MPTKKHERTEKGLVFRPPELQARVADALAFLKEFMDIGWHPVDEKDFDPFSQAHELVTEETVVESISLPRSDVTFDMSLAMLIQWANELKDGKLIDRSIFRSSTTTLVYVEPVSDVAQIASEGIEDRLGDLAQEVTVGEDRFHVELVQGATQFGAKIAEEGTYEKWCPPCSAFDTFIRVNHSKRNDSVIGGLVEAFLYELDSTLGLSFRRSRYVESGDDWDEESDRAISELVPGGKVRLRPVLHGLGVSDLLALFNEAATVTSAEYAILGYTKVVEYVAATVVKQQAHQAVRGRLLSPDALRPDAKFLDGLLALAEDQRAFQKDSEAIRLTVEICCDASQLALVAPPCLPSLQRVTDLSKTEDRREALRKLAECISSTRNQVVHAKTNFTRKGVECPEAQLGQLRACLRTAAQQTIGWFCGVPESFRVLKDGN